MSKNFKHFIKEAIGISIWELVKFLASFIFTSASLVFISKTLSTITPYLKNNSLLLLIIILFGGLWLFFVLYHKYHRYIPQFPSIDFDYRILEKEVTYEYKDLTHMIYRKRNLVKALKNNLNSYFDKYLWTGKGSINVKSAIKEHIYRESSKKCIWQFYEINFQRFLKKGEKIDTELIGELEDTQKKAVPFFSATIEEPTDYLKFNLSLNPELGVKEAICEISFSIGASKPFHTKTISLDRNGNAEWIIKNPHLLHHYEMRWIF